jgi:hypothetical protein
MRTLRVLLAISAVTCGGDHGSTPPPPPPPPVVDAPAEAAIDAPPPKPPPNIVVSGPSIADTEPSLAIDPRDPKHIVAAWMHFVRVNPLAVDAQTRASTDGGATWGPIVALPHLGAGFHVADVTLAFDRSGAAHLAFIDFSGDSDVPGGITGGAVLHAVASSLAPLAWSAPVVVRDLAETDDVAIDRPWLAIDTSSGPHGGTIYIATRSAEATPAGIVRHAHLKRSIDNGATWSTDTLIAADPFPDLKSPFAQAVVDASGTLVVVYGAGAGPGCGLACLVAARSTDGGITFTRAAVARVTRPGTGYAFRNSVAAGPAGHAAVAWVDGRGDAADVMVARTADGGATWAGPVRANDDPAGTGVGQDEPWLAYSSSGTIAIAWRDRRAAGPGPFTVPFEIYTAISADNGATFAANQRLSDAVSPSPDLESGNDFIAVSAADAAFTAVWGDHRSGTFAIELGVTAP